MREVSGHPTLFTRGYCVRESNGAVLIFFRLSGTPRPLDR